MSTNCRAPQVLELLALGAALLVMACGAPTVDAGGCTCAALGDCSNCPGGIGQPPGGIGTDIYGAGGLDAGSLIDSGMDSGIGGLPTKGVGATCAGPYECRYGLSCVASVCTMTGETKAGDKCMLDGECQAGTTCNWSAACGLAGCESFGFCDKAGTVPIGGACEPAKSGVCAPGGWCRPAGLAGVCETTGKGDVGSACSTGSDCFGGLFCLPSGACGTLPQLVLAVAMGAKQATCAPSEGAPARALFEIPRSDPTKDFYRMPFPNDIRVKSGKLDLTGFFKPGPGLLGFDPVARFVEANELAFTGFSVTPQVIFRFSTGVNYDTLKADGDKKNIDLVGIDPKSTETYGNSPGFSWRAAGGRGRYHCENPLVIAPPWENPLRPSTTYAVILKSGILTGSGEPVQADTDFAKLLSNEAPAGDPALEEAWKKYALLREYLKAKNVDPKSVISAAVFTTAPEDPAPALLAEVVEAIPQLGGVKDLTLCQAGVKSPCDDGLTAEAHVRKCGEGSPLFWELHGRIAMPVFQKGTAPYLEPKDGGGIEYGPDGKPIVQRMEDVCFALTIPKGAPPKSGYPLVIYAHGTGGHFASHVGDGTAKMLSEMTLTDDSSVWRAAVVGIDQVSHGSRRGGATIVPDLLFFNLANPAAAKGNVLQGIADQLTLARYADAGAFALDSNLQVPAPGTFDFAHTIYFGHSQGGIYGPQFLGVTKRIKASVLSGTGAGLTLSIIEKTKPIDIPAVAMGLLEGKVVKGQKLDDWHPVLTLIQLYYDPIDSTRWAHHAFKGVLPGVPPKSILHTYGLLDTFNPPRTSKVLRAVMGLPIVKPVLDGEDQTGYGDQVQPPVKQNRLAAPDSVTAAQTQYDPKGGYDGHFVVFLHADAVRQVTGFVSTYARDGIPTVLQ